MNGLCLLLLKLEVLIVLMDFGSSLLLYLYLLSMDIII